MEIKVISTGKSAQDAEIKLQEALNSMGEIDVKFISDSGMRVIIAYEKKKIVKGLTEKPARAIIKTSEENKTTGGKADGQIPRIQSGTKGRSKRSRSKGV